MISATVVADSISLSGKRITTLEIECPRIILAEINTHRMISKNYSSTRAIPIQTQIDLIKSSPALPVFYGKNQSGMVAEQELDSVEIESAKWLIKQVLHEVVEGVQGLQKIGLHKQSAARYLEPWMHVKGVLTSTEWENFFWLRCHPDAQPEFQELARAIENAIILSEPVSLEYGEWHMPYFEDGYWYPNMSVSLEDALKISASCCAQVSYRKNDDSIEKAQLVWDRLNIGSKDKPQHVSPTEHQATPIYNTGIVRNNTCFSSTWQDGITAYHKQLGFMSGNLSGWIQHRQLISGNTKWKDGE